MKRTGLLLIASFALGIAVSPDAFAQEGKKAWEHRKEAAKKREEYRRESAKKRDEYYRERAKKAREYHKDRGEWYGYRRGHKGGPPPWAPAHGYRAKHHVYFPDYYAFYDAYRGGYVYWYEEAWVFSRAMPAFLAEVNLDRARIQIMGDIPLSRHPELYFDGYARRYPRDPGVRVNIGLHIPVSIR